MTRAKRMTDERAEMVLLAVTQLALTVRDEGPEAVAERLAQLKRAARGDLEAALVIAAALVDPDRPVECWWQRTIPPRPAAVTPPPAPRQLRPCGTHAAFVRHHLRGEEPDEACVVAEREYQAAHHRKQVEQRRRAREAGAA